MAGVVVEDQDQGSKAKQKRDILHLKDKQVEEAAYNSPSIVAKKQRKGYGGADMIAEGYLSDDWMK